MISPALSKYLLTLKRESMDRKVPNISPEMGRYLHDMVRAISPSRVLEIGTANGYSTLWLASALPDGSRIVTIEQSLMAHTEALEHFSASGLSLSIEAILGDALEVIPKLGGVFDMVFIDGYKKLTLDFYLASIPLVRPGGVIIIDDVIKFGHKMESFFTHLALHAIPHTILPIDPDDGCMMIVIS